MKKPLLFIFTLLCAGTYGQEHYSGISTSRRVGLLNASVNPAELVNLKSNYEANLFNFSLNVANNKITFGEIVGGEDFEDKIFDGGDAANVRLDVDILGPAFAMKMNKWAFGISSGAKIKATLVDIDVNLGNALASDEDTETIITSIVDAQYNQRATAVSWGEIGLTAARELYDSEDHKLSGGLTFKFLFPGSYANMAADRFDGTVIDDNGDVSLTDASGMLNIAYSGSLAEDYSDTNSFTGFFAGGLNGFATDLGVNYQWKDKEKGGYLLNAGLSVKNLGSMTFKDDNNVSRNYELHVDEGEFLDLNQFEDAEGLQDIEQILLDNPEYFTARTPQRDFKVKLPAVLSAYADYKIHNNWYISAFTQQKLNEDSGNNQIAVQNIVAITPRFSMNVFETYVPLAHNEISGFTAGLGFRLGGFFIGSSSALSAAISDTDQADFYFGFRFGI